MCIIIAPILNCGCSHFNREYQAGPIFKEANDYFSQGNYRASLIKYEQILEKYPTAGDRTFFEIGIIHAYPGNEHKDYQKSLDCFQKVVKDYPGSGYRKDSEMMIFYIHNVILKDKMIAAQQIQMETLQQTQMETVQRKDKTIAGQQTQIAAQQTQIEILQQEIETLQQEIKSKGEEIVTMQDKMDALEQKVFAGRKGPADKILVEKKARRLTLFSKGEVLKTYKIALGGNPDGPKERKGDNKTPEGTYTIDSKNKGSRYHRSLRISYPNENDKKRAKELGVSPGGDIMIHGIKNTFSWVGDLHTAADWTNGCIAVTDEEIEEIEKLVPMGTVIEIRP
jgi:tetratricopeptide (TPR) repeat protein